MAPHGLHVLGHPRPWRGVPKGISCQHTHGVFITSSWFLCQVWSVGRRQWSRENRETLPLCALGAGESPSGELGDRSTGPSGCAAGARRQLPDRGPRRPPRILMSARSDKPKRRRAAPTLDTSTKSRPHREDASGAAFFRTPVARDQPEWAAPATLRDARGPRRDARPKPAAEPVGAKRPSAPQQPRPETPAATRTVARPSPSPGRPPATNPPAPTGVFAPGASVARPRAADQAPAALVDPSAAPPRLVRHAPRSPIAITDFSCSALDDADQQSLGVTYWFDAEPAGDPYDMTVHLRGHLKCSPADDGGSQRPVEKAEFDQTSTLENVVPGSGRIAFTTRISEVAAGEWEVVATPVRPAPAGSPAAWVEVHSPRLPRGAASGRTALAPLVRNLAPGVRLGAWPTLVGMGFVVALMLQALLARQLDLSGLLLLFLTTVTSALGLVGAKVYYLLTHPREPRSFLTPGMSVQGFVIVTVGALVAGSLLFDLPLGAALDVTAPGLLFGMAVGRLGCLFGGCCVGRPTSSRWGIWSSDRRVGVRRIPVQLIESGLSATVGALALLAVLLGPRAGTGLVLVGTLAAYVLGRQVLFPLRSIPRATAHGRAITLLVAALVLATSLGTLLLR